MFILLCKYNIKILFTFPLIIHTFAHEYKKVHNRFARGRTPGRKLLRLCKSFGISARGNLISEIAFTDSLCPGEPRGELAAAVHWLEEYFAGKNPRRSLKILDEGTEFQRKVWAELDKIPYGETTTYGEIKRAILRKFPGTGVSAQAVGGAVGRNKFAILRPCHRVIGANAALIGYKWGLDRKGFLLDFEKRTAGGIKCLRSCDNP